MTHALSQTFEPPRWPQALMRFVLPCDPMRDAIFGDLHEEFVQDARELGPRRARARYGRRAASIVGHAVSDSLRWRSWVSTPPADATHIARPSSATAIRGDTTRSLRSGFAGARSLRGHGVFAILALGVMAVAVVVNTLVFTMVGGTPPDATHGGSLLTSAAGIGGVVLLIACAIVAAVFLCAGPRWRGRALDDR